MNIVKDVTGAIVKNAPLGISLVTIISAFILSLVYLGNLNNFRTLESVNIVQQQVQNVTVELGKALASNKELEHRVESLEKQVDNLTEEKKTLEQQKKELTEKNRELVAELRGCQNSVVVKER